MSATKKVVLERPVLLAYVAGKFRASTPWQVEKNIREAEEVSLAVWKASEHLAGSGYVAAICPHTNTRFFDKAANDDIWLEGDKEILLRCDAVVLVDNWKYSAGATAEVALAQQAGIPVFASWVGTPAGDGIGDWRGFLDWCSAEVSKRYHEARRPK